MMVELQQGRLDRMDLPMARDDWNLGLTSDVSSSTTAK